MTDAHSPPALPPEAAPPEAALPAAAPGWARPGRRLGNILLRSAEGRPIEYMRHVTHGPTVVAVLAGHTQARDRWIAARGDARAAGINLIVITAEGGAVEDGPPLFAELADPRRRLGTTAMLLLVDRAQRIQAVLPPDTAPGDALARLAQPPEEAWPPIRRAAPVLLLPGLIDAAWCRRLIAFWAEAPSEGRISAGEGGKALSIVYHDLKKRMDRVVHRGTPLHRELLDAVMLPAMVEITRLYGIEKLVSESFYLGCYSAERQDYFRAHRDNNSPGTAKRRFALTLNLNEDFEGGGLRFPEYLDRPHSPPAGAALLFPAAAMHEALPVTKGQRYVLLGFLSDP